MEAATWSGGADTSSERRGEHGEGHGTEGGHQVREHPGVVDHEAPDPGGPTPKLTAAMMVALVGRKRRPLTAGTTWLPRVDRDK
jgi:hypothetical protein